MKPFFHLRAIDYKEVLFQTVLHLIVFLFYSFDKREPKIDLIQLVFFINYSIAVFFINYSFLPNFYYRKRYVTFLLVVFLTIVAVASIEEGVLERIFYPDTRGRIFSMKSVLFCLLDVFPAIIMLSGFKFAWDALLMQKEVDQLKTAVKESELQFLKSQINPHFLFNNLHNLYAYSIEESPKTPEIILRLSSVLRYMLYECREEYVPLTKEVEHMENFIQLNEMQIEERGEVTFTSGEIGAQYKIAPLILIVFIENAYKHSTASQADGISIEVDIRTKENGMLRFSCVNSYQAQSNTDKLSHGIGLENVKKRLELIYPDSHCLTIEKNDEEYAVELFIELSKLKG